MRADLVENLRIIRDALGDPQAKVPVLPGAERQLGPDRAGRGRPRHAAARGDNTISDWETQDVPTLTTNLRAAMKPGQVVLTHDGGGDRSGTLAAVRTVVTERLAAGWSFTLPAGGADDTGVPPRRRCRPASRTASASGARAATAPRPSWRRSPRTRTAACSPRQRDRPHRQLARPRRARSRTSFVRRAGPTRSRPGSSSPPARPPPPTCASACSGTTRGTSSYDTVTTATGVTADALGPAHRPLHDDLGRHARCCTSRPRRARRRSWSTTSSSRARPPRRSSRTSRRCKDVLPWPVGVAIDERETAGTGRAAGHQALRPVHARERHEARGDPADRGHVHVRGRRPARRLRDRQRPARATATRSCGTARRPRGSSSTPTARR